MSNYLPFDCDECEQEFDAVKGELTTYNDRLLCYECYKKEKGKPKCDGCKQVRDVKVWVGVKGGLWMCKECMPTGNPEE